MKLCLYIELFAQRHSLDIISTTEEHDKKMDNNYENEYKTYKENALTINTDPITIPEAQ